MDTIKITLKNDDEGFYGSSSSEDIAAIDHERTLAEYERQVTKAIKRIYPAATIEHQYGPYGGKSIIVDSSDHDGDGEISDVVSDIVGNVYNSGTFWINR